MASDYTNGADASGDESDRITIAGRQFEVPLRYNAGHELTAGEARQFNQTYHEHIRNNTASKIKDLNEDEAQKFVLEYATSFEFGERKAGGGGPRAPADPLGREAYRIVRERLIARLKEQGYKNPLKEFGAERLATEVRNRVENEPQWKQAAQESLDRLAALNMAIDGPAMAPAQAAE